MRKIKNYMAATAISMGLIAQYMPNVLAEEPAGTVSPVMDETESQETTENVLMINLRNKAAEVKDLIANYGTKWDEEKYQDIIFERNALNSYLNDDRLSNEEQNEVKEMVDSIDNSLCSSNNGIACYALVYGSKSVHTYEKGLKGIDRSEYTDLLGKVLINASGINNKEQESSALRGSSDHEVIKTVLNDEDVQKEYVPLLMSAIGKENASNEDETYEYSLIYDCAKLQIAKGDMETYGTGWHLDIILNEQLVAKRFNLHYIYKTAESEETEDDKTRKLPFTIDEDGKYTPKYDVADYKKDKEGFTFIDHSYNSETETITLVYELKKEEIEEPENNPEDPEDSPEDPEVDPKEPEVEPEEPANEPEVIEEPIITPIIIPIIPRTPVIEEAPAEETVVVDEEVIAEGDAVIEEEPTALADTGAEEPMLFYSLGMALLAMGSVIRRKRK